MCTLFVQYSRFVLQCHYKGDMKYMVTTPCKLYRDAPLPTIVAPTVLAFISPIKGFGVYAAVDIPVDADPSQNERSLPDCVGTYSGVVCTGKEVRRPNYAYEMSYGILPAHLGRQTDECVHALLHLSSFISNIVFVDASVLRAGDGRFLNGSCDPNCAVHLSYYMATFSLPSSSSAGGSGTRPSKYARQVVTIIKTLRYATLHSSVKL